MSSVGKLIVKKVKTQICMGKSRSFVVVRSGVALWSDFTAGEAFGTEISECSCKPKCQCLSILVRKDQNNNQTLYPPWSYTAGATEKQTDKYNEYLHTPALTGGAGRVGVNGLRCAPQQPLMISPLFQQTEKSHYLPPHYPAIPHMVDGSSLPWAPCSSHGWQCSPPFRLHLNPIHPPPSETPSSIHHI